MLLYERKAKANTQPMRPLEGLPSLWRLADRAALMGKWIERIGKNGPVPGYCKLRVTNAQQAECDRWLYHLDRDTTIRHQAATSCLAAISRRGEAPNMRLYSRLNCEGLS
jgi:hypothetical protein